MKEKEEDTRTQQRIFRFFATLTRKSHVKEQESDLTEPPPGPPTHPACTAGAPAPRGAPPPPQA